MKFFPTGIVIVFLVKISLLSVTSSERCLATEESSTKRYIHFEGNYLNLTLEVSQRPTHLLTTHIFKIILEELLEYPNVEIVNVDNDFDVGSTFTRLSGIRNKNSLVPKTMANLEVWVPTHEDTTPFIDRNHVKECGTIGPPGRFGWFIPKVLINLLRNSFLDGQKLPLTDIHWSAFLNQQWTGAFDITDKADFKFISQYTVDPKTKTYFCSEAFCNRGIFIPDHCANVKCSLLLAPFYEETKFIVDDINNMRLYVKVIWLGNNLKHVSDNLTESYVERANGGRSIVILGRSPSETIYDDSDFVGISFQSCSFGVSRVGCKYELNRLVKVAWSQLEFIAKPAYRALHEISFTKNNYKDLLNRYNDEPDKPKNQIACEWLRDNANFTKNWKYYHTEKTKLAIGGIFPLSGHTGVAYTARGIYDAAKMAMDAINDDDDLLKNYELEILVADGQCKADTVMRKFIDFIRFHYDNLVGILGPACSETVEPLAGVSKNYKTLVISYSAEGASLSDRSKYPYFFRTIGENKHYNPVYLELFKRLGWSRTAALTEDGQKYTEYISHLQGLLDSNGITFISNAKFPRERSQHAMAKYLEDLKRKRARIVIADVYDEVARSVMCEAYKLNMTARHGYVWFLPLWLSTSWYNTTLYNRLQQEKVDCTTEMMFEAINGHFSLTHAYFAPNDTIMQENVTVEEWRHKYEMRCKPKSGVSFCSHFAGYAYDAVWTFALALDKLIKQDPIAISTLHSASTTQKLLDIVKETDFNGVSGRIKFFGGPSRFSVVNIVQWLNRTTHVIGSFDPDMSENSSRTIGGKLYLNDSAIVWLTPDKKKPSDGREPPQKCFLEGLAEVLDVSCEAAIVVVNVIIFGIIGIMLTIAVVVLKKRYDEKVEKVMVTQQYMRSLGIDLLNTNQMNLDKWEIPRDKIVINRKIGEGAFGTVYGGEAYFDDKGWVAVAVKALKIGSTTEEKVDFLSEAEVMKRFEHKNIVKLLGVCTKLEPIYTVMEFMLYGDLKTFLLARRHLVKEKISEESEEISSKKLTSMALDVARALSYLAQMKFVHRDVACRNCLLTSQKMVKLGDFGMTRRMYENDYYKFNRKGMLPVRWMAPESLALGVFTPSSDVWSFGVLLYEIITFGSFPFQGMSNYQVLEHVKQGNVLAIPSGIKPQLEGLIRSCWNLDYKRRPHASEIVEFLANNPRLLTPCLDGPLASVQTDDVEDDFSSEPFTEQFRKCSVAISSALNELSLDTNPSPNTCSLDVCPSTDTCSGASTSRLNTDTTDIVSSKSCLNDLATLNSEIDRCFSIDNVGGVSLEVSCVREPLLKHYVKPPNITPNSPLQYKSENEHNKYVTLQRQISDSAYSQEDFGIYQAVTSV